MQISFPALELTHAYKHGCTEFQLEYDEGVGVHTGMLRDCSWECRAT